MKNLTFAILLCLSLFVIIGLANTNDRLFEENITLKQLYNLQQQIIEDNIPEQELDSIYHQYSYDHLNSYYKKNYK